MYISLTEYESQYIFPCIERKINILRLYSLFSRASGRYFSLQIIPLPRADAIVSYGVRSAVISIGSTGRGLIATRDKIRFITVKRDIINPLSSRIGDFYSKSSGLWNNEIIQEIYSMSDKIISLQDFHIGN